MGFSPCVLFCLCTSLIAIVPEYFQEYIKQTNICTITNICCAFFLLPRGDLWQSSLFYFKRTSKTTKKAHFLKKKSHPEISHLWEINKSMWYMCTYKVKSKKCAMYFKLKAARCILALPFNVSFVLLVLSHELQFTVESFSELKDQSCWLEPSAWSSHQPLGHNVSYCLLPFLIKLSECSSQKLCFG